MFNVQNIMKFFRNESLQQSDSILVSEQLLDNDWVKLGTDSLEDDFVVISQGEHQKEFSIQKMAQEIELIAKAEAYNLAVPAHLNADTSLASERRLEKQGYQVYRLGTNQSEEKGIFLYALVNENNEQAPITVVCRGTQLDASIIADLDPSAPGATVVQESREQILSKLNELSQNFPNRKIRVTGHSLGGSISQVLTKELLIEKRNNLEGASDYAALGKISGIDTVIFQSAGVSAEIANVAQENAEFIKLHEQNFDINFVAHVKQGDFVSRTGTYLFADSSAEVADVSLIYRNLDKPCMTVGDCLDVGFVCATAGPVGAVSSVIKHLGKNYVENRIQAHTDLFHHDAEHDLLTETYGIYQNSNVQDREKIKKVFEKDLTASIPGAKVIKTTLHDLCHDLKSNELDSIGSCASSAAQLVDAGVTIAAALANGPVQAAVEVAKQSSTISSAIEEVNKHSKVAQRGLWSLFTSCFTKKKDTTSNEESSSKTPTSF